MPLLIDFICISIIIIYEIQNLILTEKHKIEDLEKNNANAKDITENLNILAQMKVLKAFLILFAILRIITFLNFSFFINFYTRVFYKFYRKYFNLYLLPCWSILVISIYYYVDKNSSAITTLIKGILYVRKSLYENISEKENNEVGIFIISVNFAVLIFLKIFVFSLISAGIKSVYYEEIENYQKCQKKFKGKLLGDFIFFWIFSPFHGLYYITIGKKKFNEIEDEILEKIILGLKDYGGHSFDNSEKINKEQFDKKQLEMFYSFFQIEGDEIKVHNSEYINDLKSNYFMEKIQLEKRDVYVVGKR